MQMNSKHYEVLLSLYKKKVQNINIKAEVADLHKVALFELDKLCVNKQSTVEQEQYINELNTSLYEYF